jgi:hypothetical protein
MPYNRIIKGEVMAEFEIVFYEKEDGDCPVEGFLSSLDDRMRARMVGLLKLLEEKGNKLREPYSKPKKHHEKRYDSQKNAEPTIRKG